MHHTQHRRWMLPVLVIVLTLSIATPALADFIGPKRTVTETFTVCKVVLNECQYVESKSEWHYKTENTWSCSLESKPWREYSGDRKACNAGNAGYEFWSKEEVTKTETVTYPPATISTSLKNCTLQNGWCSTNPLLYLEGIEPVAGYNIIALEGTLNGQIFACEKAKCNVPLVQGKNDFTYWALSSFLDSSEMGTFTAKVDSRRPTITGTVNGTPGLNGWYLGSVTFTASASDATSGMASFTCTRDGIPLKFCATISINSEGSHSLSLTATDKAGNVRNLNPSVQVDNRKPTLNASISGTLGSNNWYTSATLNASASDSSTGSGLAALEYQLDGGNWKIFPVSGTLNLPQGKHNVNVRASDRAGRIVSSPTSFWLDTARPSVNLDASGTLGLNNWYIVSPTLTASAADTTSGLELLEYNLNNGGWTPYTAPLTLGDGIHSISFWAQDQAGLVQQVDRTYQVDTHPPQISGSLNGTSGTNEWFISDVTISASALDPGPGSGIDTFIYSLNGGPEIPYTAPLTVSDGHHVIQLTARDKAGLSYSVEQTLDIDTISPAATIDTTLPAWVHGTISLNGTASDAGSGLSSTEISLDGGQTWIATAGTDAWSYLWNTGNSPNGAQEVRLRATDQSGLTTERTINAGVDNLSPEIHLPDSWFQWDTVTLNIVDQHSGLAEAQLEISDPEGRWPTRVIPVDPRQFPLAFKWDRRFGDDTVAEAGSYDVKVSASDHLGNPVERHAVIHVVLDILPPGPTSTTQPSTPTTQPQTPAVQSQTPTTQPYTSTVPVGVTTVIAPHTATQTVSPATPTNTARPTSTSRATQIVRLFGTQETPASVTATPTTMVTPRATLTQSNSVQWLQTIVAPYTSEERVTEIGLPQESASPPASTGSSVLWGSAAAAAIAAATAYAQEEQRKREEEKARLKALEERKEERHRKRKEQKTAKMEEQRAQEAIWEAARQEELSQNNPVHNEVKIARMEAEEGERLKAAPPETKHSALTSEEKRAERKNEIIEQEINSYTAKPQEWQTAYQSYMEQKALEEAAKKENETPKAELNWWEKTKSFVSENIIQPVNTYIYQPIVKPALEAIAETATNVISRLNENVYQPFIEPVIEKSKQSIASGSAWINKNFLQPYVKPLVEKVSEASSTCITWVKEKVYQPYIQPAIEKTIQNVSKSVEWIDKKIYEPYIQPAIEKTIQSVSKSVEWIDKNIYEPYIQPVVKVVNEKVYQPYVKPVVEKINQVTTKAATWLDEKVYQPYLEPVVSDINQYIYQPLVNKSSNLWDQYGEWVHSALDAVGLIPGYGEIADGLNAIVYFAEGRYLECGLSAMSMIPLLGDLRKAGKWIDTAVGAVTKQVAGEAIEKAAKEMLEEGAEKVVKESSEWVHTALNAAGLIPGVSTRTTTLNSLIYLAEGRLVDATVSAVSMVPVVGEIVTVGKQIVEQSWQRLVKEAAEEMREKVAKEVSEEVVEKIAKEAVEEGTEKALKEVSEEVVEKTTEDVLEEAAEKTISQTQKELEEKYGTNEVANFLPLCEKYGINPQDVLTNPPSEGQSLTGWVLGIDNPANPVNHPLQNLDLTQIDLDNIRVQSTKNPNSNIVVLGYGSGCDKPYFKLGEEIEGSYLSLSNEAWQPFNEAKANFWKGINAPFLEQAIEDRKILLFNIDTKIIQDPENIRRFSLPELQLLKMQKNDYVQVSMGKYSAFIPSEQLDTYKQDLPTKLLEQLGEQP